MTTVLYVAGAGRSGSTLVASVLGQSEGIVDVGEVWKIWRFREEAGRRCGCGVALSECPFWSAVEAAAPGVFDHDPEVLDTLSRIDHARGSAMLWAQLRVGRADVGAYGERLSRLYGAIAEVAGARVIIDGSKMPGPALVAESLTGCSVKVLHLIRDPRAVAASWSTVKENPDGGHPLAARPAGPVARAWMARSIVTETLLRQGSDGFKRVAYERFAEAPEQVVDELLAFVGEPPGSPAFVGPATVLLAPTHSTDGNPARFERRARLNVRDDRWRTEIDPESRRQVERITWPLRQLYGYR